MMTVSKQDGEKTAERTFVSQGLNHRRAEWHATAAPRNMSLMQQHSITIGRKRM